MKPSPLSIPWVTLSTGVVLGLAILLIDKAESRRFQTQTRQSVLQELNTVRTLLEGQLQTHRLLAHSLGHQALAQSAPPTQEWSALQEQLQQNYPAIKKILWRPLANPTGVESAPSLERETDSLASRGQIQLQVPIHSPLSETNSSVLGQVHLIVDLERLVEESPLGERVLDLDWALRTPTSTGETASVLLGQPRVFDEFPVTADVRVSEMVWQIAGIPSQGWSQQSPLQPWIRTLGTTMTVGTMLFMAGGLHRYKRQSEATQAILARLDAQENQYRCMADSTPVILLQLDLRGVPHFANLYSQNFLGYDFPTLEEMPLAKRLASPGLAGLMEEAAQSHTVAVSRVVPIRRRNGEQVWVNWHICLLGDHLGNSPGLLCIGYDVSDRQGIQNRLLKVQGQLRRLFSLMGDRLLLVNAQGRYYQQDWDESLPLESFLSGGKEASGLAGSLHDSFGDSAAEQVLEAVQRAIAQPPQESHFCLSLEMRQSSRGQWSASGCFLVRVVPFLDEYALLLMEDMREQRNLTRLLESTQQELEERVRDRTGKLYDTNKQLQQEVVERMQIEEALRLSEERERDKAKQLEATLKQLKRTQAQLVQTEKMSSLGQLAAGMAHEINNPVNFIYGNLTPVRDYLGDLLELLHRYQEHYPQPPEAITSWQEEIDVPFLQDDLFKILQSMEVGVERIQAIISSLKNFARLDEMGMKSVNLHEGIESTLMVLQNRLRGHGKRPDISLIKQYGDIPKVTCYASQINQVLMNLFDNAIDAIQERLEQQPDPPPQIRISTHYCSRHQVSIVLEDNGIGIPEAVQQQVFNPFFTTKAVGKGTGLGLSIAYQVIHEAHGGSINITSRPGQTQFEIQLPTQPTL
ncbi:PAS domain S-box protein [Geitlerinema sp. P-1104]|uniref:ATP-binding protein n=1 Tax=Geitlerinema sp. P-1104 TaxID=2546230 RepID=UPI0014778025|nr:ATP-binding protein [Geitlerinema sp. P-1104]NMG58537.1 PAS domain S-box protein [Geitlerinema sp. P-1104]